MDSVVVFREGEIDGKPFHISSILSQPSSSSSSSSSDLGGDQLSLESLQPRFICPTSRVKTDPFSDDFIPYHASPHFPSTTINDLCELPLLPILWCNNKEPNEDEFQCRACYLPENGTSYYMCPGCEEMFHKECVETPLEIQNPSSPFLSFQLYHSYWSQELCIKCKSRCYGMFYHCPTKEVSMHPLCARKLIDVVIDHPRRHPHTLTFFPRQAWLPCDVCGLVHDSFPTYICHLCIFVVHEDCISFPFVIKISRHPHHRISFIYSLPSGNWFCGVCRLKVDNRFGAYSCNKCNEYFVHSKCAVREDVWDGKELERVPEEPEEIVEPFVEIADGIIHHFLHDHHLKLEVSKVYNDYTICQACVLPIYEDNYYSCLDGCDFVLHETCASAPRKIHHALHAHPLILKPQAGGDYDWEGYFTCDACRRSSCGFVYEVGDYMLDVRCASVSEPFEYQGHEHPLYLSLDRTQEKEATCRICRGKSDYIRKLNCIECKNYVICFRCATLPYKAKYKHDEHFLTFQEGKEGSDVFDWCEVCEKKIEYSSEEGFYACDHCCTTLHVDCLLGDEPYMMKPGQVIKVEGVEVHIISNNTQSRPLCHYDDEGMHLCSQKVVYKWNEKTYRSWLCSYSG